MLPTTRKWVEGRADNPPLFLGNFCLQEHKQSYDLSELSVFLAMPTTGNMPALVVACLLETNDKLKSMSIPIEIHLQVGGTICAARNKSAAQFLKSGKNRLLFIDSDMVWTSEDVIRLLAFSTSMDIVQASYTTKEDVPVFFVKVDGPLRLKTNEHGCIPIDGTGMGLTVLSRTVIEHLSGVVPTIQYMKSEKYPQLFKFDYPDGEFRGEDIGFFQLAKEHGFTTWLDPMITLGHMGTKLYRASIMDLMRVEAAEAA